jgi:2OG-Fe(II) oxygenase superfamily
LQTVEAKLTSVGSFTDSVLRDLSTLLCESLDPPIPTAVVDNPKNPGLSNMCLGLATAPAGTSLMGSHLDEDLLTITFYDEPFLEVLERTTQEWKLVEVFKNMPIVNVGDSFQKASNDRLYAPFHRVKQSQREINLIMYDLNKGSQ